MRIVRFALFFSLLLHCVSLPANKIVVVGAGLAGLTTAYRLQQLGYDVEVYEARCRPGGRVCTAYFDFFYEELGGKNIQDGGDALNLRTLIREMGLSTQAYSLDVVSGVFLFNDQIYPIEKLITSGPKPTEELHKALLEQSLTAQNLGELVEPLFQNNPALGSLIRQNMRGYMGSSAYEVSAKYLDIGFWDFYKMIYDGATDPSANRHFIMEDIVGGNSCLIEGLVKALKGHIHYTMPLRKITFKDTLLLGFENVTEVSADYLVLAIPASTLRDVVISDGLIPKEQLFAIHTQHYGTNAKILLPIQKKTIRANIYNCFEDLGIWLNKPYDVMTWYYGGTYGDFDCTSLPQVFNEDLDQLHQILPTVILNYRKPIMMKPEWMAHYQGPVGVSWVNEEFSKGSYSNLSPEQFDLFNEITFIGNEQVRSVYRPVHGIIFFAGEHTSIPAPSTMEGAVESGEKAARLLHASVIRFHNESKFAGAL